jgi:hypothetical protein
MGGGGIAELFGQIADGDELTIMPTTSIGKAAETILLPKQEPRGPGSIHIKISLGVR